MTNNRKITITVGSGRRDTNWRGETLLISDLYDRLKTPRRGQETMETYLRLPKGQQDDLKDVGGFVGGTLSGRRRQAGSVTGRDLITLDMDNLPPGGADEVIRRVDGLGCGYCIYSTRKHRPEAPRLRVVVPIDRTVTPDEYEAVARYTARAIQPEMSWFDPTTFQASRLMYWASACANSNYVYQMADKPLLSADGLLAQHPDWRDVSTWPTVPGADKPKLPGAKQADPTTKPGLVGAFCRTYDVPAAMGRFLPGVYVPVDGMPGRYSYAKGSTTGGAVVYDNGLYLFSHHATDPCSGREVNAWDMVRLHLFGDRDEDAKPDTPTNRLPSYTAMSELAGSDSTVAGLLADERYAKAQAAFDTVPDAAEVEDDGAWRRAPMMDTDTNGLPLKSLKNLRTAMENDPKLKGKLQLNLFSGRIDVTGTLPWGRPEPKAPWSDDDLAQLRVYLEPLFGKAPKADVQDAVAAAASDQAYHPVRDYLESLAWDGVPRLDTLLIDYMGAEDSAYTRAVTRKAFTAAVARIMRPGCKYDTMLVLVGSQGRYKSSILHKMGGAWFSDSVRTFEGKEAMEVIQGTWINEVAEMQAMSRDDINAVKAFLTKTNDYFRAAYGRYTKDRPRQCVFFGTTNSRECLVDLTGGRRFLVLDIDQQPRSKNVFRDLDAERDQLWAEAVVNWRMGEPLYLSGELEEVARQIQEEHRARHPWEGPVLDFLAQEIPEEWPKWDLRERQTWVSGGLQYKGKLVPRSRVCAAEIWCEVLNKQRGDMKQRDAREINSLLEKIPGWENVGVVQAGKPYGSQRCFERQKAATN